MQSSPSSWDGRRRRVIAKIVGDGRLSLACVFHWNFVFLALYGCWHRTRLCVRDRLDKAWLGCTRSKSTTLAVKTVRGRGSAQRWLPQRLWVTVYVCT